MPRRAIRPNGNERRSALRLEPGPTPRERCPGALVTISAARPARENATSTDPPPATHQRPVRAVCRPGCPSRRSSVLREAPVRTRPIPPERTRARRERQAGRGPPPPPRAPAGGVQAGGGANAGVGGVACPPRPPWGGE